jgi:hypothetical protein
MDNSDPTIRYLATRDAIERQATRNHELRRIAAAVESGTMSPAVGEVLIRAVLAESATEAR